jgi:hypothetical protein
MRLERVRQIMDVDDCPSNSARYKPVEHVVDQCCTCHFDERLRSARG